MHTLVVIGYLGIKRAYLDLPRAEAIRRYNESEGGPIEDRFVTEFTFTDEFNVYDAWNDEVA